MKAVLVALAASILGAHARTSRHPRATHEWQVKRNLVRSPFVRRQNANESTVVAQSANITSYNGTAYWGLQMGSPGACGSVYTDDDLLVGLSPSIYGNTSEVSPYCGATVIVTNADTGASVTVNVTDAFESGNEGDIYISVAAFELVANLDDGIFNCTWSFSNAPLDVPATPSATDSTDNTSASDDPSIAAPTPAAADDSAPAPTPSSAVDSTETTNDLSNPNSSSTTGATAGTNSGTSSDGWKNTLSLTGQDIVNFFTYETGASDYGGQANYVDASSGLIYAQGSQAVFAVDSTQNVAYYRNSVRAVSTQTFNVGSLVIVDVAQMPDVCGCWPALWLVGPNWPSGGEIDLIEGVNRFTMNGVSFHTNSGCQMADWDQSAGTSNFMTPGSTQQLCDSYASNNLGCGMRDTSTSSFGPGFNGAGGGIMALRLDNNGAYVWHFDRNSIPSDIVAGLPVPSSWGKPVAVLSSDSCNIGASFSNLNLIVNTNLGGTWPSDAWSGDTSYAGEAQNCAAYTGDGSMSDYIQNQGGAFADAKWVFNSIQAYGN